MIDIILGAITTRESRLEIISAIISDEIPQLVRQEMSLILWQWKEKNRNYTMDKKF